MSHLSLYEKETILPLLSHLCLKTCMSRPPVSHSVLVQATAKVSHTSQIQFGMLYLSLLEMETMLPLLSERTRFSPLVFQSSQNEATAKERNTKVKLSLMCCIYLFLKRRQSYLYCQRDHAFLLRFFI